MVAVATTYTAVHRVRSASTAIKRYMNLCRIEKTDSCLSPLDSAYQLSPLREKWAEYFVFTFVSWDRRYWLGLVMMELLAGCC